MMQNIISYVQNYGSWLCLKWGSPKWMEKSLVIVRNNVTFDFDFAFYGEFLLKKHIQSPSLSPTVFCKLAKICHIKITRLQRSHAKVHIGNCRLFLNQITTRDRYVLFIAF